MICPTCGGLVIPDEFEIRGREIKVPRCTIPACNWVGKEYSTMYEVVFKGQNGTWTAGGFETRAEAEEHGKQEVRTNLLTASYKVKKASE